MNPRFPSISYILAVLLLLTACQPTIHVSQPTSTPSGVPTNAARPTATVIPSPTPLVLDYSQPAWNDVRLTSICLELTELYDTPSPDANPELHRARLEKLLRELGMDVSTPVHGCGGTLHIDAGYFISSSSYSSESSGSTFECITGFNFKGVMVITSEQLPPLYTTVSNETGNEPYVTLNGCPDQSILFDTAWSQGVLEGLSQLMGPTIITTLYESKDSIHRNAAFGASRALGPEDVAVLPDVIKAITTNTDVQVRLQIASGIQNLGPEAQKAASIIVPSLLEDLKTSQTDPLMPGLLDQTLVEIFGKLGPGATDAIPTLLDMANNPDSFVSSDSVLQAIGNMGPEAKAIVPDMLEEARNGGAYTLEALGQIGPVTPDVVPTLMEIALDYKNNYWLSAVAMESLGKMASQSPDVLPFLLSAAQETDAEFAALGLRGLGLAGTASPEVFQVLKTSLSHPKDTVRIEAINALKKLASGFGPESQEVIPTLIVIARTQDSFSLAPFSAVDTLSIIGKDSPEVNALFNDLLLSNHVLTDFAVENLGPESRDLLPALIETLQANQIGGPQDIASLTPYLKALISITGEYPGPLAEDWRVWLEAHSK